MVKNTCGIIAAALCFALSAFAQENKINRLPEIHSGLVQHDYSAKDQGFWIAVEAAGGYSCRLFNSNFALAEVSVTPGYRFNEFFRIGVGIGGRYYFDNTKVRYSDCNWAFPLFANFRGNFYKTMSRSVVPFYSMDLGGTIRDGFMFRPSVGIRVGRQRAAFILSLAYTGQELKSFTGQNERTPCRKFVSFVTLKAGYEF